LKFTAAGTADDDEFTLDSEVKGLSFGFYIQGPAPYEFSVYLFFQSEGEAAASILPSFPYIPPYRLLKYNLIIRIRQGSL
jgi:hypothetical protein